MHRVWLPLLITMAACGRHGEENLGLSGATPTIDVAKLTQPAGLARALSLTGHELDARLGAHRMDATSTLKLEPAQASATTPVTTMEETFAVQSDGRGAVHLVHDNSRGNGFEATALEDDLYVKPRYGKFVRRKREGDELERLRASAEGTGAAYLHLLERFVQVREAGTANVAGH